MVQPADFPKALYVSQSILFVVYIAVGATVYATVGAADWLTSPLSLSLSPSTSRAIAVMVHSLVILHVTYVEGACHAERGTGVCCGAGFYEHVARKCGTFDGPRGVALFSKSGIGWGRTLCMGYSGNWLWSRQVGPRRCPFEQLLTWKGHFAALLPLQSFPLHCPA